MNNSTPLTAEQVFSETVDAIPVFSKGWKQANQHFRVSAELPMLMQMLSISLAVQPTSDVRSPLGNLYPVSVSGIAMLGPAQGKSTIMDEYLKPFRAYEKVKWAEYDEQRKQFPKKLANWDLRKKMLESKVKSLFPGTDEHEEAMEKLAECTASRPTQPIRKRLIYEDVSKASLFKGMEVSPHVGLFSSEGALLFDGEFRKLAPHLNKAISGETITIDRSGKEPTLIEDARLTFGVFVQPEACSMLRGNRFQEIRKNGLVSRLFFIKPEEEQEPRLLANRCDSRDAIDAFHDRIIALIEMSCEADTEQGFQRNVLTLSPEAAARWRELMDWITVRKGKGCIFENAHDHAGRLGENILRLAGALHMLEGFEGMISRTVLDAAILMVELFSTHFLRTFHPVSEGQQAIKELDDYFADWALQGGRFLRRNDLLQIGPNAVRTKAARDAALQALVDMGKVRMVRIDRTMWVDLQPHLPLPNQTMGW